MSILSRTRRTITPARKSPRPAERFGVGLEVDTCPVPAINGAGLSLDEYFRVNGARNRARAAYAADCQDASPGELDRVADAAAGDALRSVLRDRPVADPLPCCSPAEPVP